MEAEILEVNTRFRPSGKSTQQFLLLFQKLLFSLFPLLKKWNSHWSFFFF